MLKIKNLKAHLDREITIPHFALKANESCFLYGASGIGKTSLLNLICGIIKPISGEILFNGTNINLLNKEHYRANDLGYIFQQFNLIEHLTVFDNIKLALQFAPEKTAKVLAQFGSIEDAIYFYLHEINLRDYTNTQVKFLSIGQKQRVASIRALIGNPKLILADEPTSALDEDNKATFINFLTNECANNNIALIFVSHDLSLKQHFQTSYHFQELLVNS